jgi:Putative Actinobacterial Holin-X, holin superfamily III
MASGTRSVTEVVSDLFGNVQDIVHAELQLARTETRNELKHARSAIVLISMGAMGALLGAFFVLVCLVDALSLVIPPWAAALIVGVALALAATLVLSLGVRRFGERRPQSLPKSRGTMEENVEWTKPPSR